MDLDYDEQARQSDFEIKGNGVSRLHVSAFVVIAFL